MGYKGLNWSNFNNYPMAQQLKPFIFAKWATAHALSLMGPIVIDIKAQNQSLSRFNKLITPILKPTILIFRHLVDCFIPNSAMHTATHVDCIITDNNMLVATVVDCTIID